MRTKPPHIDLESLLEGMPKNIVGPVYAMSRPARPQSERDAVRSVFDCEGSGRKEAGRIASRAVSAFLEYEKIEDEFERAVVDARQALKPDAYLAIAFQSDVPALFIDERSERYLARECRQLSPLGWAAEGRAIASLVKKRLLRRYREFLR